MKRRISLVTWNRRTDCNFWRKRWVRFILMKEGRNLFLWRRKRTMSVERVLRYYQPDGWAPKILLIKYKPEMGGMMVVPGILFLVRKRQSLFFCCPAYGSRQITVFRSTIRTCRYGYKDERSSIETQWLHAAWLHCKSQIAFVADGKFEKIPMRITSLRKE